MVSEGDAPPSVGREASSSAATAAVASARAALAIAAGEGDALSVLEDADALAPSDDLMNRSPAQAKAPTSVTTCLLYTSPSPRDHTRSRMPSPA